MHNVRNTRPSNLGDLPPECFDNIARFLDPISLNAMGQVDRRHRALVKGCWSQHHYPLLALHRAVEPPVDWRALSLEAQRAICPQVRPAQVAIVSRSRIRAMRASAFAQAAASKVSLAQMHGAALLTSIRGHHYKEALRVLPTVDLSDHDQVRSTWLEPRRVSALRTPHLRRCALSVAWPMSLLVQTAIRAPDLPELVERLYQAATPEMRRCTLDLAKAVDNEAFLSAWPEPEATEEYFGDSAFWLMRTLFAQLRRGDVDGLDASWMRMSVHRRQTFVPLFRQKEVVCLNALDTSCLFPTLQWLQRHHALQGLLQGLPAAALAQRLFKLMQTGDVGAKAILEALCRERHTRYGNILHILGLVLRDKGMPASFVEGPYSAQRCRQDALAESRRKTVMSHFGPLVHWAIRHGADPLASDACGRLALFGLPIAPVMSAFEDAVGKDGARLRLQERAQGFACLNAFRQHSLLILTMAVFWHQPLANHPGPEKNHQLLGLVRPPLLRHHFPEPWALASLADYTEEKFHGSISLPQSWPVSSQSSQDALSRATPEAA